jgi:hypothetical protein
MTIQTDVLVRTSRPFKGAARIVVRIDIILANFEDTTVLLLNVLLVQRLYLAPLLRTPSL